MHLQREKQKHYELKSGIAYEGWEHLSQKEERYRLVNKRVYCHSDSSTPFWDGSGVELSKHWDLGYTELVVLGGDDANWINKEVDELGFCVRQLDGFHLARSCRKGWEKGKEVYDATRSGDIKHTLGDYGERSGKTAQKEREHVLRCLEKGIDWLKKVVQVPEGARGLGTMESNEDKLFAYRMKKLGMSWTIPGAQRIGKVI